LRAKFYIFKRWRHPERREREREREGRERGKGGRGTNTSRTSLHRPDSTHSSDNDDAPSDKLTQRT